MARRANSVHPRATKAAVPEEIRSRAGVGRIDYEVAFSVVDSIAADGGRAVAVAADCTVEDDLHRLESEVGQPVATSEETAGHWRQVLDGDLTATFLAISTFLPDLTSRTGAIVTMSSSAARQATGASAAYAAAKAGVIGLSRHLAGELAGAGVRVNCLAPATVENDRMRKYMTTKPEPASPPASRSAA